MRNTSSRWQRPLWLTLSAGLVLLVVPLMWAGQDGDEPQQPRTATELLQERLAVLREAAKLHQAAFVGGEGDFAATLRANQAVLDAQLEFARTPAERIEIRTQLVSSARALEDAVAKMVMAREAARVTLLDAMAHRLRMEADLLSERAGVKD